MVLGGNLSYSPLHSDLDDHTLGVWSWHASVSLCVTGNGVCDLGGVGGNLRCAFERGPPASVHLAYRNVPLSTAGQDVGDLPT